MPTSPKKSVTNSDKVMDVSAPGDTPASPTNRPILVTNRSVLTTDPMVAPREPAKTKEKPTEVTAKEQPEAEIHREKILEPIVTDESTDTATEPEVTGITQDPALEPPKDTNDPLVQSVKDKFQGEKVPDSEAEATAREAELLAIAEQGTYVLPVHRSKKHRHHMIWVLLFTIVFAAVALDILLDIGTITIDNLPHTDFLQ